MSWNPLKFSSFLTRLCVYVTILALTVSACAPQPPQEAVALVMSEVASWWFPLEVANIQVTKSHPVELTATDRANGIEEIWCITVTLLVNRGIWEHDDRWKWEEQKQTWLAKKQYGQWIVEFCEEGC